MELMSLACRPQNGNLEIRVYYNYENEEGEFETKDFLINTKDFQIPENVWNVIIELVED